jgi:L-asparaginase
MTPAPEVRIICCGGTIDKVYFDAKNDYEVGQPQVNDILDEANVFSACNVQSLIQKDSLEINDADRQLIYSAVALAEESHVLITHGTDTMVETAQSLLDIADKTVVITGSLLPAKFRNSDALFNIGFAYGVTQTLPPGVYIAMHGRVFDPNKVRKNLAQNRFEDLV